MNADATLISDLFDLELLPELQPVGITAIVLCHNEALRLPYFLEFHKLAGVDRFLVVDNNSNDGSSEILEDDPAVVRFPSSSKYSECKSIWREVLADHYCLGQWTLFLDVDELFVHADWPDKTVGDYAHKLDVHGYDCLMTTMVDMYPEGDLKDCKYLPGTPFLDTAPMFDTGNYRMETYGKKSLINWPTPPVNVRGGARERLFHSHVVNDGTMLERLICKAFYGLNRSLEPSWKDFLLDKFVSKFVNRAGHGIGLPNMSKVSLLKWRRSGKFNGGVHRVNQKMDLAPDIGALLHFKYFDDFGDRAHYLAELGQHVKNGAHYKLYSEHSEKVQNTSITFAQSERFTGVGSLLAAGLMRNELENAS